MRVAYIAHVAYIRRAVLWLALAGCLAEPDLHGSQFHCSADHLACPDGLVCNTNRDRDTCQLPCSPSGPSCPDGQMCIDYGDSEPVFLCGTTS